MSTDSASTSTAQKPPAPLSTAPLQPLPALLRAPAYVGHSIAARRNLPRHALHYLAAVILSYSGFGLAAGLFGGWSAACMAMAKAPLIAIFSFVLCLPSLYVFSCLGGSPLDGPQIAVLGMACLAMVGLLLTALAPVVWLFAVSTSSLPFVVMLDLLVWFVGLSFTIRFIGRLSSPEVLRQTGGMRVWLLVLVLTSMQMVTFLRPFVMTPGATWWTPGKQFFLAHFASCFDDRQIGNGVDQNRRAR